MAETRTQSNGNSFLEELAHAESYMNEVQGSTSIKTSVEENFRRIKEIHRVATVVGDEPTEIKDPLSKAFLFDVISKTGGLLSDNSVLDGQYLRMCIFKGPPKLVTESMSTNMFKSKKLDTSSSPIDVVFYTIPVYSITTADLQEAVGKVVKTEVNEKAWKEEESADKIKINFVGYESVKDSVPVKDHVASCLFTQERYTVNYHSVGDLLNPHITKFLESEQTAQAFAKVVKKKLEEIVAHRVQVGYFTLETSTYDEMIASTNSMTYNESTNMDFSAKEAREACDRGVHDHRFFMVARSLEEDRNVIASGKTTTLTATFSFSWKQVNDGLRNFFLHYPDLAGIGYRVHFGQKYRKSPRAFARWVSGDNPIQKQHQAYVAAIVSYTSSAADGCATYRGEKLDKTDMSGLATTPIPGIIYLGLTMHRFVDQLSPYVINGLGLMKPLQWAKETKRSHEALKSGTAANIRGFSNEGRANLEDPANLLRVLGGFYLIELGLVGLMLRTVPTKKLENITRAVGEIFRCTPRFPPLHKILSDVGCGSQSTREMTAAHAFREITNDITVKSEASVIYVAVCVGTKINPRIVLPAYVTVMSLKLESHEAEKLKFQEQAGIEAISVDQMLDNIVVKYGDEPKRPAISAITQSRVLQARPVPAIPSSKPTAASTSKPAQSKKSSDDSLKAKMAVMDSFKGTV